MFWNIPGYIALARIVVNIVLFVALIDFVVRAQRVERHTEPLDLEGAVG